MKTIIVRYYLYLVLPLSPVSFGRKLSNLLIEKQFVRVFLHGPQYVAAMLSTIVWTLRHSCILVVAEWSKLDHNLKVIKCM